MSDITLYIINDSNAYAYKRVGSVKNTMLAVFAENENFTLTPPPDYDHVWRWIDDKWIADQPS